MIWFKNPQLRKTFFTALIIFLCLTVIMTVVFAGAVEHVQNKAALFAVFASLLFAFMLVFLALMANWLCAQRNEAPNLSASSSDESPKAKSVFFANISHEIRTPMNTIVGMSELILREDLPKDVYSKALTIKSASYSLLSIINDVLDLSKIESGDLEILDNEYEFSSLISDVIDIIRIKLIEKPVEFIVDIDPDIPASLKGDDPRIRQILLNILGNAVKYTQEGFINLSISGTVRDGDVMLNMAVSDSGIGIKADDMEALFGQFVKLDSDISKPLEGAGLGLAIARKLCRAMGGDVSVESEYGKGSTFTITLSQKISEYAPFANVEDAQSKSVLLIEGNPLRLASIMKSLKALGVSFDTAKDISALSSYAEKYTHVIIDSTTDASLCDEASDALEAFENPPNLIALTRIADSPAQMDAGVIVLPASTLSIADILNDIFGGRDNMSVTRESFTAPGVTVLIVDDMTSNLMVAEGLLAPYEMDITTCNSGEEAIRLIINNRYDLIFMDHMMPKMDGIEATGHIRSLRGEYFANVPIIALTANAVSGVREMFVENGMSDFLAKPIEIRKLDALLEKWIPADKRKEGPRNSPAQDKSSEAWAFVEVLNAIPELSTKKAIRMMGSDANNYVGVLKLSVHTLPENVKKLNEYYINSDSRHYAIEVHGIKGVLNNIGAYEIGKIAYKLEHHAKLDDMETCRAIHPDFLERLNDFLETLNELIDKSEVADKPEGDKASLLNALPELVNDIDFFNATHALELLEEKLKYTYGQSIDEAADSLKYAFEAFDFDEAAELLAKLKEALTKNE